MRGFFVQLLLLFLIIQTCFAQKEASVWYFGNYAGIDFTSGEAKALSTSKLSTTEGCASVADKQGQLLFYTDGITLWNKAHKIMANGTGLKGDASSTQSAVIIPRPASAGEYYVFTVDNVGQPDGFRYSVVDMTQENGYGKVTVKNEPILAPVTEKLTAIAHRNGKDIWVLVHAWNSNAFYAYLVTEQGFTSTPVISNTGTTHTGRDNNTIGNMKASPDGAKLALAVRGLNMYELFDFNNATGRVSNPVVFQSKDYSSSYGMEFSPDGSKLYINSSDNPTAKIYQVDLSNANKITLVGTSASDYAGSMQLAPDGKIYFSRYQSNYIGVIHQPNEPGASCKYVDNGFYLEGKRSTFGLPNFIQSWFYKPVFTFSAACFSEPTLFSITDTSNIRRVRWMFDDPVIGVLNESAIKNPAHLFSNPGEYEVMLYITYKNGQEKRASRTLTIAERPQVSLGEDKVICLGQTLILGASLPDARYQWQDGSTEQTFTVNKPGTYWVDVFIDDCPVRDSVTISYTSPLLPDLGKDTVLCTGNSLLLKLQTLPANTTYRWQDGSTEANYIINKPGIYWVQTSNSCQTVTDSITITYRNELSLDLGENTPLCSQEQVVLNARQKDATATYLWQDGSTEPVYTADKPGTYWVQVSDACQQISDTVEVSAVRPLPESLLGEDFVLAPKETLLLQAAVPYTTCRWQDGSTDTSFKISAPGTYWVEISNGCEIRRDSIVVSSYTPVKIDLGKETVLCKGNSLQISALSLGATYLWQDGSTDASFTVNKPGTYWVQVSNGYETLKDSVIVTYSPELHLDLGENTTLCGQEQLVLDARQQDATATYLWQDGSTEANFIVSKPGTYWVQVSNACETLIDSITISCPECVLAEMPNVITPNNDGMNDSFEFACMKEQIWGLEVYNRWGKLVYQSSHYAGGWDAANLENGVYYYNLINKSRAKAFKGNIHVLR